MSMNSFHARQKKPRPPREPSHERPAGVARADALLVAQKLAPSRTAAQWLIKEGRVSWAGGKINKPAMDLPEDTPLTVAADPDAHYVSRGGLKLAGALAETGIKVAGKVCLDVGQSTGGFTDCLLQNGARHVVGVDVGHDQLHAQLRADPAVTAIEGINCRALTAADLGTAMPAGGFELIVGDVSFISLTLILPQLPALLAADGDLLLLVKPQFEVGPDNIGRGGIVRDPALYAGVERKFFDLAQNFRLTVKAWLNSPITGGDGNREFFIWLKK
ncbi:MAG: TlyA family RNA methyltransferase [Gammaproteobacteria bacterium]|nr:TlyA family RNA methyltransferase [Gammaproteobacteria bacterium]MBU1600655.1 TlyA family RNA methyltransferase [Gammaproteobacteria bacterium]MBU2435111.1 TlyA family RNA methyltransferase [Gammaproteobacteria bacterium]MBU2448347.1 TlyA family RNA methyltransferase [Gammaproteobacteria bacterium]